MNMLSVLASSKTRIVAGVVLLGLLFIQLFVINTLPKHWQLLSHEICLSSILFVVGLTLAKWKIARIW